MHKAILDLLDKHYYLEEFDYDSSFNNSLKEVQEAIQKQEWYPLDELITEWTMDWGEYDPVNEAMKELRDRIVDYFDVDEEKAEAFVERHENELRDAICDRDQSTPLKDLCRHTGEICFFYDLNYSVYGEMCLEGEEENRRVLKEIKEQLKIKSDKWDRALAMMIDQATTGYECRLVVYFNADIEDMMGHSKHNVIHFKNPMVALIDTGNGAGDHTELPGHEFWVPFTPDNLWVDKTLHYSYVYDVCGMIHSWCDCTQVQFKADKRVKSVETESSLQAEVELEHRYQETFKKGGCTPGDMDIRRHRDTYYLNEFPCGTHCPHCHTFWID